MISSEEYDSVVLSYEDSPCEDAPGKLGDIKLKYVGSPELGNRYVIIDGDSIFGYNLELREEQITPTFFELTSGQRWFHPPKEGQLGVRTLSLGGGWPKSLRSIAINPEIVSKARERTSRIGRPFVGVHFRNTDMGHDISEIISSTRKEIQETGIGDIFLATDDSSSYSVFQEEFENCKIHTFSHIPDHRALGQSSIHYMSNSALGRAGLSKRNQIEDALCDIIGLSDSEVFVPSEKSAMSQLVSYLREEQDAKDIFVGS